MNNLIFFNIEFIKELILIYLFISSIFFWVQITKNVKTNNYYNSDYIYQSLSNLDIINTKGNNVTNIPIGIDANNNGRDIILE